MNQTTTLPVVGRNFTRFTGFTGFIGLPRLPRLTRFAGFFRGALAACVLLLSAVSGAALAETETTNLINLNTADAETLQYIPGIGPGKSADIVRVREETGGFKIMEDLLAVPGIGEKTLEDIKKFGSLDSGVSALTEEMQANPPRKESAASG